MRREVWGVWRGVDEREVWGVRCECVWGVRRVSMRCASVNAEHIVG